MDGLGHGSNGLRTLLVRAETGRVGQPTHIVLFLL